MFDLRAVESLSMKPELEPTVGWTPSPEYYPEIAESEVNGTMHYLGRTALGLFSFVRFGRAIVVTAPGFDAMKDEIAQGNIVAAPVHRADLDTVLLPSVLERVGIHHARPMSKIELFQNSALRWAMLKLGAFAVDRKNADNEGLSIAQAGILRRADSDSSSKKRFGLFSRKPKNGNVTIYPEAKRINKDVLKVAKTKTGAVVTAITNDSLVVPIAFAGLSTEKIGEKPHQKVVSRDKRSWFGLEVAPIGKRGWHGLKLLQAGPRLVFTVGVPIGPKLLDKKDDDESDLRTLTRSASFWNDCLRIALQEQLDLAYSIRGSAQEIVAAASNSQIK